ncbi:uncharacterized protein AMSG_08232 [Thecamonas trahens ATCC 50062]|uniref:Transmembrane protein n=1 Tax=Thecamonas trahens ATCC 50062 TaxID=461836 RepID=A0A0L0DI51_THETB|nr:hypothetical protein AMSG_08232 [Thecamonas trahens ATCC 50062]KNC51982.1 hypothetical protein AMSG_08232 [Thecamonas trahens ATCC 50062]|eukprot:XP_013755568.1 hypothetical protein AMSG_08232 [Thecamonas trahens ATCC 50062]
MRAEEAAWFVVVSALWGMTNPLLKAGSKGVEDVAPYGWAGPLGGWLAQTVFLLTRWQYVVPFAANQGASALFLYSLGAAPLSVAVPLTNALTFAFTAATGWVLGEKISDTPMLTAVGMAMVCAGIAVSITA